MKKEVKDRIKALQTGIQACKKRMDQLCACLDIADCPLCKLYRDAIGTCDHCPAYSKSVTDEDDLTCDFYADTIEILIQRLAKQQHKWAFELGMLKAGTKK